MKTLLCVEQRNWDEIDRPTAAFRIGQPLLRRAVVVGSDGIEHGAARCAEARALGIGIVLTDPDAMQRFCRDFSGDVEHRAVAVLRPRSTEEVTFAVKACRALELGTIPQGGVSDGNNVRVILSLECMNRIRQVDLDDFSAIVEAGCVLLEMKCQLASQGMFFPLALGAQGSCRIGGNVSTNAGSVNVLRYAMTRELVLGLEVVLPDGSVFNGLSTMRKDNRGIDLKQLFNGAEGIFGIVTAVAIKLMPLPDKVETAMLGINSLEDAIALYRRAAFSAAI